MSGPEAIAAGRAASFCMSLVRERDFQSYAAALFVPPALRRAHLALAAFNAEIVHVRDLISQPMPGEIRLQWWRDVVTGEGAARGDALANPVAAELLLAIETYGLPAEAFVRLIDAHVFDVYDDPMPDMAALEAHCRDTSAALFALRAQILGAKEADLQRIADHAGIADGLADVMTALPKHAARRQLYLPGDLLGVKHVRPEDVFAARVTTPLNDALAHLRAEARRQLDAATALLRNADPQIRPAFLPLAIVSRTLNALENAVPFDPPQLSRLKILWALWRAARSPPFKA